jgi:uncharacterized protein
MTRQGNYIFELDERVSRTTVRFPNRYGITIAADLYLPKEFDATQQHAAVLVGPPYGGVKEQTAGIYAHGLARRGFVALAFDPSHNGDSSGQPRRLSSPDLFVEDFSAAVDFLGTREYVDRDRIGGLGLCGSGGFVLSAASVDPRIKAVATVVMYDITRAQSKGWKDSLTKEDRDHMLASIAQQRYAEFDGASAPLLTGRGAALDLDEADPISREFGEFYSRPRGFHPNSTTQFTLTSSASMMNFPILTHIDQISPRPILLVTGEHAHSRYFSEDAYARAAEPKELYSVPGAGHVDLYDKTDLIPFDKLEKFYAENLD